MLSSSIDTFFFFFEMVLIDDKLKVIAMRDKIIIWQRLPNLKTKQKIVVGDQLHCTVRISIIPLYVTRSETITRLSISLQFEHPWAVPGKRMVCFSSPFQCKSMARTNHYFPGTVHGHSN